MKQLRTRRTRRRFACGLLANGRDYRGITRDVSATGLFIQFGLDETVGRGGQILKQLASIGFTAVFAVAMSLAILFVLKLVLGDLRADEEAEYAGLDLSEHQETAYGAHSSG